MFIEFAGGVFVCHCRTEISRTFHRFFYLIRKNSKILIDLNFKIIYFLTAVNAINFFADKNISFEKKAIELNKNIDEHQLNVEKHKETVVRHNQKVETFLGVIEEKEKNLQEKRDEIDVIISNF
jgi:hypothetical protein